MFSYIYWYFYLERVCLPEILSCMYNCQPWGVSKKQALLIDMSRCVWSELGFLNSRSCWTDVTRPCGLFPSIARPTSMFPNPTTFLLLFIGGREFKQETTGEVALFFPHVCRAKVRAHVHSNIDQNMLFCFWTWISILIDGANYSWKQIDGIFLDLNNS